MAASVMNEGLKELVNHLKRGSAILQDNFMVAKARLQLLLLDAFGSDEVKLVPYGSMVSGIIVPSSDFDFMLSIPGKKVDYETAGKIIGKLSNKIEDKHYDWIKKVTLFEINSNFVLMLRLNFSTHINKHQYSDKTSLKTSSVT